jgi:hypothetical protein
VLPSAGSSGHSSPPASLTGEEVGPKVLPPCLRIHLERTANLSTTLLQMLATHEVAESDQNSNSDDLLTGFHFTDGRLRIIVVEGRADAAMKWLIFEVGWIPDTCSHHHSKALTVWDLGAWVQIVKWAQMETQPVEKGMKRKILYNRKVLYPSRLYASLGVDLWIMKSRQSLRKLLRSASSYTRGQV